MKRKSIKFLAGFLSVVMLLSVLPMSAYAGEVSNYDPDFVSETHDVFKHTESTIAPGVEQYINYAYSKDGKQMVYYVAVADIARDDVVVQTSYYKQHEGGVLGMEKLTNQMAYAKEKYSNPNDEQFISEYYTPVAGVNASFYNMTTGQPMGVTYIDGVSFGTTSYDNFFAILKDGTAVIDYRTNEKNYTGDQAIWQAVAGSQWLLRDGEDVTSSATGSYNTDRHSRACVGITADGKVVFMQLDGRQEPFSCGGSMHELAQIMLEAGCVSAINLDGGGSATYVSRPEGEDELKVINRPSDGSERSISAGLMIASLAAPSNTFDRATLTAESEYITPNSTVNVTATGVSPAGTAADIPENATWSATLGTVENGVFTSDGTVGDAEVKMLVDGKVVGSTVIHVVNPDKLSFSTDIITVPYGKTVTVEPVANYGYNEVPLKASDVSFELENPSVGTIDGFSFTACEENDAVTGSTLTASLISDPEVKASVTINLGKGSEVVKDFEDGSLGSLSIRTGYPQYGPSGANGQNEVGNVEIVTSENGKVHDGKYALAVECDYTQLYETGYHMLSMTGLDIKVPANAQTLGLWLYLPELEELSTTSMRIVGINETTSAQVTSPWLWDNCTPYGWDNDGWRYVTMDISGYNDPIYFSTIQMYICDRDNSDVGFYFKDNASVNGKFTYYMDSFTVDYSTAVDDREPPVFSDVLYADSTMSDAVKLNNQTAKSKEVSFTAKVDEDTTKSNYTGLDASSAKASIDGVAVDCTYKDNTITVQDAILADGIHTVRFEMSDKMGNMAYITRRINVQADSGMPTVSLEPVNPDADKILIGSLYWMNVVASDIEKVESVEMNLNLNSVSTWELDHMNVKYGFNATYTVDEVTNNATIKFDKTGEVADTGKTVLAQLPIRTWESRLTTYPGYENQTPEMLWSRKIIWPIDIKLSSYMGKVSYTDGTNGSFSMEPVEVITELYGNYGELNANGDYANKKSWHQHTAEAMEDKAATCTEEGYTGRTFCSECNSVVDWGTTIPATGHNYTVIDGVLQCEGCGKLFNGVYTDGKTYVDGVVIANGWNGDSYYLDGVKLTGLQEIDGFYYDFGENGVCAGKAKLDGFYYNESAQAYMYFTAGIVTKGEAIVQNSAYYFDENGYAISGNVSVLGYDCTFDEKGAFVSSTDDKVVDAGYSGTNIQFVLLNDGTLKVDGKGAIKDYTANGIYPAWYVRSWQKITAIEIGNGITEIGEFAFYRCYYTQSITFEENSSLKVIGMSAFQLCQGTSADLVIPASVEIIEPKAFYGCDHLKNVTFEENSKLTTIGVDAFSKCLVLENVYLPDGVKTIDGNIFNNSTKVLVSVLENSPAHSYVIARGIDFEVRKAPAKVVASGTCGSTATWEFYDDGKLVIGGSGAITNFANDKEQPWKAYSSKIQSIEIGKEITHIGNWAFAYVANAKSVTFEKDSKLESIGSAGFFYMVNVTEFEVPDSVKTIGASAFAYNSKLTSVVLPYDVSSISTNTFNNSTKVVLSVYEGTYAETYAKTNNKNYVLRERIPVMLQTGTFGNNFTWTVYDNGKLIIDGEGAMPNLANDKEQPWRSYKGYVKTVEIGKNITSIGNWSFAYMTSVDSVVFAKDSKLQTIGAGSFLYMTKLPAIQLPDSLRNIYGSAFSWDSAMKEVYIPQDIQSIQSNAFNGAKNVVLNVVKGSYGETFAKNNSLNYVTRERVPVLLNTGICGDNATWSVYDNGSLVISGSGAMNNLANDKEQPWRIYKGVINKVVIGKDITTIGNWSFAYMTSVKTVEFEEDSALQTIGAGSFLYMTGLTSVNLPISVRNIYGSAFAWDSALVNVYIPQNIQSIQSNAFNGAKNVVLNVALGTYGETFAKTNGFNYVTRDKVAEALQKGSCGDNAVWSIYDDGRLVISGSGAMTDYANDKEQPWRIYKSLVTKVEIGKDITKIGNWAFAYMTPVTSVTFEEGSKLKTIGSASLLYMTSLTDVVLPDSVTTIMGSAFMWNNKMTSVVLPAGVSNIQSNAFKNCSNVKLSVVDGTYAHNYAIANNYNYVVR